LKGNQFFNKNNSTDKRRAEYLIASRNLLRDEKTVESVALYFCFVRCYRSVVYALVFFEHFEFTYVLALQNFIIDEYEF